MPNITSNPLAIQKTKQQSAILIRTFFHFVKIFKAKKYSYKQVYSNLKAKEKILIRTILHNHFKEKEIFRFEHYCPRIIKQRKYSDRDNIVQ